MNYFGLPTHGKLLKISWDFYKVNWLTISCVTLSIIFVSQLILKYVYIDDSTTLVGTILVSIVIFLISILTFWILAYTVNSLYLNQELSLESFLKTSSRFITYLLGCVLVQAFLTIAIFIIFFIIILLLISLNIGISYTAIKSLFLSLVFFTLSGVTLYFLIKYFLIFGFTTLSNQLSVKKSFALSSSYTKGNIFWIIKSLILVFIINVPNLLTLLVLSMFKIKKYNISEILTLHINSNQTAIILLRSFLLISPIIVTITIGFSFLILFTIYKSLVNKKIHEQQAPTNP